MSIRSELEKSASYLRNARKAILGRGGEISLMAGLKDLPDAIYNIPADASLSLVTDEAIAYQKNVPAQAEEYARISKLGGMTYVDEENNTLVDAKVTEIISNSANLFDEETLLSHSGAVVEGDFIKIPNSRYTVLKGVFKENTVYTLSLSCYRDSGAGRWAFEYTDKTNSGEKFPTKETYTTITSEVGKTVSRIYATFGDSGYVWVRKGTVMLNEGTEAAPYKPYRTEPVETFPVHEAIQSLDGYGQGNPDNEQEYNYIDFVRKVFVAVGHIVNDAWVSYNAPIETDISAYLPNDGYIKVEGGGTITMQNEHERDIPSTLKYIAKVGS